MPRGAPSPLRDAPEVVRGLAPGPVRESSVEVTAQRSWLLWRVDPAVAPSDYPFVAMRVCGVDAAPAERFTRLTMLWREQGTAVESHAVGDGGLVVAWNGWASLSVRREDEFLLLEASRLSGTPDPRDAVLTLARTALERWPEP